VVTGAFARTKTMQKAGCRWSEAVLTGTSGANNRTPICSASCPWSEGTVYALPSVIWNAVGPVAALGYGASPSSTQAVKSFAYVAKKLGLKAGYLNESLPFGTVNTTAIALALKSKGVEGIDLPLDTVTNFGILTAAQQAGIKFKVPSLGRATDKLCWIVIRPVGGPGCLLSSGR